MLRSSIPASSTPSCQEIHWAHGPQAAANDAHVRSVPVLFVESGFRANAAGLRLARIRRVDAASRAAAAQLLRELRAQGWHATRYQAGQRRAYRVVRLAA